MKTFSMTIKNARLREYNLKSDSLLWVGGNANQVLLILHYIDYMDYTLRGYLTITSLWFFLHN